MPDETGLASCDNPELIKNFQQSASLAAYYANDDPGFRPFCVSTSLCNKGQLPE
jgi:hypothetical protein